MDPSYRSGHIVSRPRKNKKTFLQLCKVFAFTHMGLEGSGLDLWVRLRFPSVL